MGPKRSTSASHRGPPPPPDIIPPQATRGSAPYDGYRRRVTAAAIGRGSDPIAFIASGMADIGFGLETAARRFGLDFVPILRERYFFACDAAAIERPALRLALSLMRSADFRAVVDALPGYDGRIAGTVVPVQHAFARSRK